jgi:hypothetical protein
MSQKYKGKQSNNIHRQKRSKILINRKLEKSLQVAQKRGTKILQVPNPVDPLKSSNEEQTVFKSWICTTSASSFGSREPWTEKPSVA